MNGVRSWMTAPLGRCSEKWDVLADFKMAGDARGVPLSTERERLRARKTGLSVRPSITSRKASRSYDRSGKRCET
jgi:hypothetical protein